MPTEREALMAYHQHLTREMAKARARMGQMVREQDQGASVDDDALGVALLELAHECRKPHDFMDIIGYDVAVYKAVLRVKGEGG